MLNIFDFNNYRQYLEAWIDSHEGGAYGLKGKIAKALGISSGFYSQIMKGEKTFTADQISNLSDFIGLNELESDYLHLLLERDRAATPQYRDKLDRKIKSLQDQSLKIGKRVPRNKELSDEQKAIYYSSWLYTGIRNLTAIPGLQSVESIAEHLKVEPQVVAKIVRFLLENGLCKENKGGITYGPTAIHIDKESPFVNKHHQNWRFQAINHMERKREADVFFTSPMSLSEEAAVEIRKMIPTFIQSVMKISGPSESETTMCLNIDWFKF